MLYLNGEEVNRLVEMGPLIDALESSFASLARGEVILPQRLVTTVASHAGVHLTMPVYVGGPEGRDLLAVKIVTVFAHNRPTHGLPTVQAVLVLHDAATGQPVALMEAEELTSLRTGAVSGLATRRLANPDASTLLMIGSGALAFHQVEAVCAVRPIERVLVCSRTGTKDEALCGRITGQLHVEASPARLADALPLADVICTATTATTPLFDGSQLRPGCHINAVGAYTPGMCELDANTLRRARVFVDSRKAARSEAGDLIQATQGAAVDDLIAGTLGEVILGRVAGRERPDQNTVFKSVGLALQDATAAGLAFAAAVRLGMGRAL